MKNCIFILLCALLFGFFSTDLRAGTWEDFLKHGDSLYAAHNYDSAIVIGHLFLERALEENGREDTSVAWAYHVLGRYYGAVNDFDTAIALTNQAIALKRKLLPPDHPSIFKSMYNSALFTELNGDDNSAIAICLQAIDEFKGTPSPEYDIIIELYWYLGRIYRKSYRCKNAIDILRRAQAFISKAYGIECGKYVLTLNTICRDYMAEAEYDTAIVYADSAVELGEALTGIDDYAYTEALNVAAYAYYYIDQSAKAEAFSLKALSICRSVFGHESSQVLRILHNLAPIYMSQAKYNEAENTYLEALRLYEMLHGEYSTGLANHCFNMAVFYEVVERLDDAEHYIRKAMHIWEKVLGTTSGDYGAGMRVLGELYTAKGLYAQAEPLYLQSLNIMKSLFGPYHDDVGYLYKDLGNMYTIMGMYKKAEKYFADALKVDEQFPIKRNIAYSLSRMGMILSRQGDYREAEHYYQRMLDIRKEIYGADHPEYADALRSLGLNYTNQERYEEAGQKLNQALAILKEHYDSTNIDIGRVLWNLAYYNSRLNHLDAADSQYQAAYEIYEKTYGSQHIDCADLMEEHSICLRMAGAYEEALNKSCAAYLNKFQKLQDNIIILSERNALDYAQTIRESVNNYLSAWMDVGQPSTENIGDIILVSKGLVFDEIMNRNRSLIDEGNDEIGSRVDSLKNTKLLLSHFSVTGPKKLELERYRSIMDSLQVIADKQETELARISSSFRKRLEAANIDAKKIIENMPDNAVLVEYLRYEYRHPQQDELEPRYIVSVLKGDGTSAIIDLGQATNIDSWISQYRQHLIEIATNGRPPSIIDANNYRRLSRELYNKVWKPVEQYLSDDNLVLVAADGGLNMVSFAGLMNEAGEYVIENHTVHYLSSGRDIVRFREDFQPARGLFALGDPDYDAPAMARITGGQESQPDSVPEPVYYATRNVRSGCGAINSITVSTLPFTRNEIKSVARAWEASSDESAAFYYGADASEENFKAEAPGHRVIHLATHGYYLEGACRKQLGQRQQEESFGYIGENPLLFSGLLFAGANLHGQDADSLGAEDGILTAYEVSSMDLSGTELAVLSACETGLGEVEEGEGVYGLRRAFQMAGVRTIISALWSVSDEATAAMMSQLYTRQKAGLPEVLRRIQLEKIKRLREQGDVDHPFTWGAFIVLGDWR